jgi:hypothetical protein
MRNETYRVLFKGIEMEDSRKTDNKNNFPQFG